MNMHNYSLMKWMFILTISSSLAAPAFSQSQFTSFSDYPGAATWTTFLVQNNHDFKIAKPPNEDQTLKELAEVKHRMKKVDPITFQQIQYWNAGAPAYRWNEIANALVTFERPNLFFRFPLSWMNVAVYDATILAWRAKQEYNRKRPSQLDPSFKALIQEPSSSSYPCEHSTTASAAAIVLSYFLPEKADSLMNLAKVASMSRIAAGVSFPTDVEAGWKLGEEVAEKIIALAKKDGSQNPWKGTMPSDAKLWSGNYPVGINICNYTPMVMKSANQFRPPAPPDFSNDMKDLKNLKQDFRTTYLAHRWASLSGSDIFTDMASKKIFEYNLQNNTPLAARIYALLHVALYDASIAIMDAKYAYWGIRPFQYDPSYKPLIETPPFPGYPSGHATASATAATVLSHFFPADAAYFKDIAKECADSRFYAGIHFQTDNIVGLELGEKLAKYIIETWENKDAIGKK